MWCFLLLSFSEAIGDILCCLCCWESSLPLTCTLSKDAKDTSDVFQKCIRSALCFRVKYDTFDILTDDEVRQGLKKFSDWPTYPQLYVNGELLGGLDIIKVSCAYSVVVVFFGGWGVGGIVVTLYLNCRSRAITTTLHPLKKNIQVCTQTQTHACTQTQTHACTQTDTLSCTQVSK